MKGIKNVKRTILIASSAIVLATNVMGATPSMASTGEGKGTQQAQSAPQSQVSTGFTYQGKLLNSGSPASGQYDLQFRLYDAATAGTQVGATVSLSAQAVSNGLFTANLDFGTGAFNGSARWLEISMRQTGGGTYTTLAPRQALTAAPYALSLMPGAVITGTSSSSIFSVSNTVGNSIEAYAGTGARSISGFNTGHGDGLYGQSDSGNGLFAQSNTGVGVFGSSSYIGVYGTSENAFGVWGNSNTSRGVYGQSNTGPGGYFVSDSSNGLEARAGNNANALNAVNTGNGTAVFGQSDSGKGAWFLSNTGTAVQAQSNNGAKALFGSNSGNGYGVYGESASGNGGYFKSDTGNAVEAYANGHSAIAGINSGNGNGGYFGSQTGYGVWGASVNNNGGRFTSTNSNALEAYAGNNAAAVKGVDTGSGIGIYGVSNVGTGGYFSSTTGTALYGEAGDFATALAGNNTGNGNGISGNAPSGIGVKGTSDSNRGVQGVSNTNVGVYGTSASGTGGYFYSNSGNAVESYAGSNATAIGGANSGNGNGGNFSSVDGNGAHVTSTNGTGIRVASINGKGGFFTSDNSTALEADAGNGSTALKGANLGNGTGGYFSSASGNALESYSNNNTSAISGTNNGNGNGVYGNSTSGDGVDGRGRQNGVYGKGTGPDHTASIYGEETTHCSSCWAGFFAYDVNIGGLTESASSAYKIDDPTDPGNKYLEQSSVSSPDMLNIYRGHVTMGADGTAWVQMPDYFQALNMDFDYQLTAVGKAQPNLYVAQEVSNNRFQVGGGVAGAKVSWQVTGVRHDPYANANRIEVQQQKPAEEKGLYLHPELYNQPESKSVNTLYTPDATQQAPVKSSQPQTKSTSTPVSGR